MEVIEVCTKGNNRLPPSRTITCPCNTKCTKKYVQPARVKSFAPKKTYSPSSKPLDASTTYHLSYLNVDQATIRGARSKAIRPTHNLSKPHGKFSNETTSKSSYKPLWGVIKPDPILPKSRSITGQGPMENVTTIRRDYPPKYTEKTEKIVPSGSIRTCTAPLDSKTTTGLSYVRPETVEPAVSFKPASKYCPPSEPLPKDTTQKLSYQPFSIKEKEVYPWTQKTPYKPPDTSMCGKTTYSESYLETESPVMERPIVPIPADIFPRNVEFAEKTIYKESYVPCEAKRVAPIVPCNSISMPDAKMTGDTTSKLSYLPVRGEKRNPIIPRARRIMMGDGPMQCETTSRQDFKRKTASRPSPTVPCSNIRTSDAPMEGTTTTGLSYVKPGPTDPVQSFKPVTEYCRPVDKFDSETVNKLSYQPWTPGPKEEIPWARKSSYEPSKDPMAGDTIYHMSYPAPGYYVDDCTSTECPCSAEKQIECSPNPVTTEGT